MNVLEFVSQLKNSGIEFFTGVPDSQLKPLCNYLMNTYGLSDNHIIAANEGNAVALVAGIIYLLVKSHVFIFKIAVLAISSIRWLRY